MSSPPSPTQIAQQLLQFGDSYQNIVNELNGSTSVTQIQSDMTTLLASIRTYMTTIQSYAGQNPQDSQILNAFSLSMKGLVNADADLNNVNKSQAVKDASFAQGENQQVFSVMVKTAVQNCQDAWAAFVKTPNLTTCTNVCNLFWALSDNWLIPQINSRGAANMAGAIGISTADLAKLITVNPDHGGFLGQNWKDANYTFLPGFQKNPNYIPDPSMMNQLNSNFANAQTIHWPN
jgi:hypothetical protein